MRKERSVLVLVEEREYTREILRRKSDIRKVDIVKYKAVMLTTIMQKQLNYEKRAGRGNQAMRVSNYKITTYKIISLSQGFCKVLKTYGRN